MAAASKAQLIATVTAELHTQQAHDAFTQILNSLNSVQGQLHGGSEIKGKDDTTGAQTARETCLEEELRKATEENVKLRQAVAEQPASPFVRLFVRDTDTDFSTELQMLIGTKLSALVRLCVDLPWAGCVTVARPRVGADAKHIGPFGTKMSSCTLQEMGLQHGDVLYVSRHVPPKYWQVREDSSGKVCCCRMF